MVEPKQQNSAARGWRYVREHDVEPGWVRAKDGHVYSIQKNGAVGRIWVSDPAHVLPSAGLARCASAVGDVLEERNMSSCSIRVEIGDCSHWSNPNTLHLDGKWLTAQSSRHAVRQLISTLVPTDLKFAPFPSRALKSSRPTVLFFESLMSTEIEHNAAEISQGVLHILSALGDQPHEVRFAQVKMPIEGENRPVVGLESLDDALASGPVHLICITLLEGYWEGAKKLIAAIRARGSRARIAVGGVMPTLTPDHVAVHLPEVSFVCRGAGEGFVRNLLRICGETTVDDPFTISQCFELASLDGIIALDPLGGHYISGRSDLVYTVPDLDRIELNLSHVHARHLVHGVEISTSRGCIHRCTFCGIMGRESYQARSSGSIIDVLHKYEKRFHVLFGDNIPPQAFRLHLADDDFACDRTRAAAFFDQLQHTRFRLSSVQVSVADLCLKSGGKLLPEIDPEICDAIVPERFADHGRDIPLRSFITDKQERNWSSYLQIGVETFCDAELKRLGKGYRLEHVRTVIAHMASKNIHVDAYFIQSNGQTTAEELLSCVAEICRLKLAHPIHFHVRFPAVKRLVSFFPSAAHRRNIRQGRSHVHHLRGLATVDGYPEFDYPFVDYDIPQDIWVDAAVQHDFFTGEGCYTESLGRLSQIWRNLEKNLPEGAEKQKGARLILALDDLRRRLVFEWLRRTRLESLSKTDGGQERFALSLAQRILGPASAWTLPLQRWISQTAPRMVLIPTWQCELRCRYCAIPKQDGRVMPWKTARLAIDTLLSSSRDALMLQFFGGEALLEWNMVQQSIRYGLERARKSNKTLSFILSSNGMSIDAERLNWLKGKPVKLELSLDGDQSTQHAFRRSYDSHRDSYGEGIGPKAEMILNSGLAYDVIMVCHPENAHRLMTNFQHIAALGYRRIQINYANGVMWNPEQMKAFADQLMDLGKWIRQKWQDGDDLVMINLESEPMPMRLNGEITVDYDGSVHAGNAFLQQGIDADKLMLGHLDDHCNFDRYWLDSPSNDILIQCTFPKNIRDNNTAVGAIFSSFIRWMRKDGIGVA